MKYENKVISLELAKRIAEAVEKKGVKLPENELWWIEDGAWFLLDSNNLEAYEGDEKYPAYDVAELGEILPTNFNIPKSVFIKDDNDYPGWWCLQIQKKRSKDGGYWYVAYWDETTEMNKEIIYFEDKNLAEAMGKMLLYLLENDLHKT